MKKITDYAELVKAKHALNKTIAPVEDGANIAGSYTSGKQFIRGGVLYTALTTIAENTAWSSLTLDTDYELADDLTSQLASLNQTLTNEITEESAIRDVLGAKNIFPNKLVSGTSYGVAFVNNGDGTITANGTFSEVNATLLSNGWSDTDLSWITPFIGKKIRVKCGVVGIDFAIRFYDSDNTNIGQIESGYNGTWGEDTVPSGIHHYAAYLFPSGTITLTDALIFPRVDYEPYSMTNQELTPIAQAVSNRNLLDNPWFTVNQRGFSTHTFSIAAQVFTADRWKAVANTGTGEIITLNNGVISVNNTNASDSLYLLQNHEQKDFENLNGKTVTVSALLADGTVKSNTFVYDESTTQYMLTTSTFVIMHHVKTSGEFFTINFYARTTSSIKAVKLELGSVSTLAMDTAPNYAEELLKCQRYFQRVKASNNWTPMFTGLFTSDSIRAILPLLTALRTTPTISVSDATKLTAYCNGQSATGSSLSVGTYKDNDSKLYIILALSSGITSTNYIAIVFASDADLYIDLSADL